MGENPFFEETVRIQHERNHHLIDTGPYRFVGYFGLIIWVAAFPALMGSVWEAIPVG